MITLPNRLEYVTKTLTQYGRFPEAGHTLVSALEQDPQSMAELSTHQVWSGRLIVLAAGLPQNTQWLDHFHVPLDQALFFALNDPECACFLWDMGDSEHTRLDDLCQQRPEVGQALDYLRGRQRDRIQRLFQWQDEWFTHQQWDQSRLESWVGSVLTDEPTSQSPFEDPGLFPDLGLVTDPQTLKTIARTVQNEVCGNPSSSSPPIWKWRDDCIEQLDQLVVGIRWRVSTVVSLPRLDSWASGRLLPYHPSQVGAAMASTGKVKYHNGNLSVAMRDGVAVVGALEEDPRSHGALRHMGWDSMLALAKHPVSRQWRNAQGDNLLGLWLDQLEKRMNLGRNANRAHVLKMAALAPEWLLEQHPAHNTSVIECHANNLSLDGKFVSELKRRQLQQMAEAANTKPANPISRRF